jgi:hypothetical protein
MREHRPSHRPSHLRTRAEAPRAALAAVLLLLPLALAPTLMACGDTADGGSGDPVGTGPPSAGQDGAACLEPADCFGAVCLTELENGLPDGYCTTLGCTPQSCNGGLCVVDKWGNAACVDTCVDDGDCRAGYSCEERGGASLCDFVSAVGDDVGASPGATCLRGCDVAAPFRVDCGFTPSRRLEGAAEGGGDLFQWGLTYRTTQGIDGFVLSVYPDPDVLVPDEDTGELPVFATNLLSARNDAGDRLDLKGADAALNVSSFGLSELAAVPFPSAPAYEAFVEGNGGLLQVRSEAPALCLARAEALEGDSLELHIYLVGAGGLAPDLLGSDPDFRAAVDELQRLLGLAGVEITRFVPHTVSAADVEAYRIIRDEASLGAVLALTEDPGAEADADADASLVLNLVLVDDILPNNGGDLVGRAGLLPGPAGVHGTAWSGVVAEVSSLREAPEYVGLVIAHEAAHFLGLRHTTEVFETDLPVGDVDPLVDTPTCPDLRSTLEGCPDYHNLMFPLAPLERSASRVTLSDDQAWVLRRSPLVR